MRKSRNAGLLYGVVPPSTKANAFSSSFGSHLMISGGKKTGAAVLARTSCQSGIRRLQSERPGSLYLADGLLLIGHAESVVAFRVTTTRRQARLAGARSVSAPNVRRSVCASSPSPYSDSHRSQSFRLTKTL